MMSPGQKAIVKSVWTKVVPIADTAAQLFYDRLFEIDPSTRPLFKNSDMANQRRKLIQALATVVNGLDDLAALVPVLEGLGKSHVRYGVTDKHYAALLWTLEQGLGDAWTPAAKDAWSAAYAAVAGAMLGAAHQAATR